MKTKRVKNFKFLTDISSNYSAKQYFLIIICILFLAGCNNVNHQKLPQATYIDTIKPRENIKINKSRDPKKIKNTYKNRDRHRDNYLFLHFWTGMDTTEYAIIRDSLLKCEVIEKGNESFANGYSYYFTITVLKDFGDSGSKVKQVFSINPQFEDNSLVKVSLFLKDGIDSWYKPNFYYSDNIVNLYEIKYGNYIYEQKDKYKYPKTFKVQYNNSSFSNIAGHSFIPTSYEEYYKFEYYTWYLENFKITISKEFENFTFENDRDYIKISDIRQISLSINYTSIDYLESERLKEEKVKEENVNEVNESIDLI